MYKTYKSNNVYKAHKQTTTQTIPLYCFRQRSGLTPLSYYFKEQEPTTSSIVYDSTGIQTTDTVTTGYDSYSGTVYVNSVMCIRYNTGDTSYEKETITYKALRS